MPRWRRYSRAAENGAWPTLALALALIPLQPAALEARARLFETRLAGVHLAHPRLARAVPAAGARLTSAPTALRLTFTEVPELTFTRLTLIGAAGDTVPLRPPAHATDDVHTVVAVIDGAVPPGQLTVIWQTAGPDAHPIRGRYRFTVATAGAAGAAPDGAGAGDTGAEVVAPGQAPPPAAHYPPNIVDGDGAAGFRVESPLFALVRWLLYAALLPVVGAVVFHRIVLGRVRRRGGPANAVVIGDASTLTATLGLLGTGVLLVAVAARLVAQSYAVHGAEGALEPGLVASMLGRTVWGWGWLVQLGAAVVAIASFARARAAAATGWLGAELAALVLSFTPALSGHAVSADRWVPGVVLADGLHVLGAGGWIGTLFLVVAVGLPVVLRLDTSERGPAAADLINAFSPVALGAAGLLALTGFIAAWVHLGALSALWQTGYGRTLILKLGVLAVVAGTGAYNWRWVRPALGDEVGARRIRKSATVELAVAAVVLAITAFLVATPTPRSTATTVAGAAPLPFAQGPSR